MSEPNDIAVEFKQVVKSFGEQRVLNTFNGATECAICRFVDEILVVIWRG